MPHSTRTSERAKRGGLTRNQARKAGSSARQSERLAEAIRFGEQKATKQAQVEDKPGKRTRKVSMSKPAQKRRIKVLWKLESLSHASQDKDLRSSLKTLIDKLKSRITISYKAFPNK